MDHHFIVFFRRGVAWNPQGAGLGGALEQHVHFLESGYRSGLILMAGPLMDDDSGVAVMRAASRAELLEKLDENPAIAEGLLDPEVHGWMPWDLENGIDITEIELKG